MKPLARREIGLAAVAAAMAVLLSACSGGSGGSGKDAGAYDPKAKVTITWWTGQIPAAEKLAEQLAHEYEQKHPNVTIKVSPGASNTDDILSKLSAGFGSGNYPDISYAYGSWAGALDATGKMQDLTTYVEDQSFAWDEFSEAARDTATPNGKVIGVPAIVDNLGVLYNKKLFDAAGLPYPKYNWTWQQFRDTAKKLTDLDKGVYGTAYSVSGSEDTTWHLWPLLWQKGGDIMLLKKPTFNSAEGVSSLEFFREMAIDDKSMYLDQTDEKYLEMFNQGKIGMEISGPWTLLDLKAAKLDYGVVDLPSFNGDHQTVSGPDIWALFKHDDANREGASRDFMKWFTSEDIDARWNMGQGNLPLRSSEQSTPEFAKYVKEWPGAQEFFDNLDETKEARPTVAGYEELSRHVGEAISKVLQGRAQPKEALDRAAEQSASALAAS